MVHRPEKEFPLKRENLQLSGVIDNLRPFQAVTQVQLILDACIIEVSIYGSSREPRTKMISSQDKYFGIMYEALVIDAILGRDTTIVTP
jgi:hypothetical protein